MRCNALEDFCCEQTIHVDGAQRLETRTEPKCRNPEWGWKEHFNKVYLTYTRVILGSGKINSDLANVER